MKKGKEFLSPASATSLFDQEGWTLSLFLIYIFYVHCLFYFKHSATEVRPSYLPYSLHYVFILWTLVLYPPPEASPQCHFVEQLQQNPVPKVHWPLVHSQSQGLGLRTSHSTVCSLVVYPDNHQNYFVYKWAARRFFSENSNISC